MILPCVVVRMNHVRDFNISEGILFVGRKYFKLPKCSIPAHMFHCIVSYTECPFKVFN